MEDKNKSFKEILNFYKSLYGKFYYNYFSSTIRFIVLKVPIELVQSNLQNLKGGERK